MRRAIAMKTMIGLIILLASFMVVLVLLGNFIPVIQGFRDGGVCGASAAFSSIRLSDSKVCVTFVESPFSLRCERRHVEIRPDRVSITSSGQTRIQDLPRQETIAMAASEVVAQELANCWQTFGQGQTALFPQAREDWFSNELSGEFRTACHICSEINFAGDINLAGSNVQEALNFDRRRGESYLEFMNSPRTLCKSDLTEGGGVCWEQTQDYFTNPDDERRGESAFWRRFVEAEINEPFGGNILHAIEGPLSLPRRFLWESIKELDGDEGVIDGTKLFSKIEELDSNKSYAVVMMREGLENCDGASETSKVTMFAYVIPHDELEFACDVVIP